MKNQLDGEKIIGIRVDQTSREAGLEFSRAEISETTLAEMSRHHLRPILDMTELQKRGDAFMILRNFAGLPDATLLNNQYDKAS